ncbi:DUF4133 domain-containing protein [Albibacterium profundi]|uniref:DUF4133 domain-containing protein n=1 Tax=Albibacterium profundi TaxID=3134906 RepID=A0ABV5CIC7_9SPHI
MASIYKINKGINKPIEFKGFKAQYIAYLGIGLVVLMILFAILYIMGVNLYICILTIGGLGTGLFTTVFRLSLQYGEYGLLKRMARKNIPEYVRFRSRRFFPYRNANLKEIEERRDDGETD